MRTIRVENSPNYYYLFITDWNFKKWTLIRRTDGKYDCKEITGISFNGADHFLRKMYGESMMYSEYDKSIVFLNYEIVNVVN